MAGGGVGSDEEEVQPHSLSSRAHSSSSAEWSGHRTKECLARAGKQYLRPAIAIIFPRARYFFFYVVRPSSSTYLWYVDT